MTTDHAAIKVAKHATELSIYVASCGVPLLNCTGACAAATRRRFLAGPRIRVDDAIQRSVTSATLAATSR